MEDTETAPTNPYKPFIKLIAGKPTTKTGNKRKYGWEIKIAEDNISKQTINEIEKLNDKMIKDFGEEGEGIVE